MAGLFDTQNTGTITPRPTVAAPDINTEPTSAQILGTAVSAGQAIVAGAEFAGRVKADNILGETLTKGHKTADDILLQAEMMEGAGPSPDINEQLKQAVAESDEMQKPSLMEGDRLVLDLKNGRISRFEFQVKMEESRAKALAMAPGQAGRINAAYDQFLGGAKISKLLEPTPQEKGQAAGIQALSKRATENGRTEQQQLIYERQKEARARRVQDLQFAAERRRVNRTEVNAGSNLVFENTAQSFMDNYMAQLAANNGSLNPEQQMAMKRAALQAMNTAKATITDSLTRNIKKHGGGAYDQDTYDDIQTAFDNNLEKINAFIDTGDAGQISKETAAMIGNNAEIWTARNHPRTYQMTKTFGAEGTRAAVSMYEAVKGDEKARAAFLQNDALFGAFFKLDEEDQVSELFGTRLRMGGDFDKTPGFPAPEPGKLNEAEKSAYLVNLKSDSGVRELGKGLAGAESASVLQDFREAYKASPEIGAAALTSPILDSTNPGVQKAREEYVNEIPDHILMRLNAIEPSTIRNGYELDIKPKPTSAIPLSNRIVTGEDRERLRQQVQERQRREGPGSVVVEGEHAYPEIKAKINGLYKVIRQLPEAIKGANPVNYLRSLFGLPEIEDEELPENQTGLE